MNLYQMIRYGNRLNLLLHDKPENWPTHYENSEAMSLCLWPSYYARWKSYPEI